MCKLNTSDTSTASKRIESYKASCVCSAWTTRSTPTTRARCCIWLPRGAGRLDEAQMHILRLLCVADHDPNDRRWGYETQVRILLTVDEQGCRWRIARTARFRGSLQLLYMRAMAEYVLQDHNRAAQTLEELIASPPLHEVQFGSFANLQTKLYAPPARHHPPAAEDVHRGRIDAARCIVAPSGRIDCVV